MEKYAQLFTEVSVICAFIVQLIKEKFPKVPNNIISIVCSIIIGGLAFIGVTYESTGITSANILHTLLGALFFGIACGFGSMFGYDKIKQCLKQINKIQEEVEKNEE